MFNWITRRCWYNKLWIYLAPKEQRAEICIYHTPKHLYVCYSLTLYSAVPYNAVNFLQKRLRQTLHSLFRRARYAIVYKISIWFMFCFCHSSAVCNIMMCLTALLWYLIVLKIYIMYIILHGKLWRLHLFTLAHTCSHIYIHLSTYQWRIGHVYINCLFKGSPLMGLRTRPLLMIKPHEQRRPGYFHSRHSRNIPGIH